MKNVVETFMGKDISLTINYTAIRFRILNSYISEYLYFRLNTFKSINVSLFCYFINVRKKSSAL